MFEGLYFMNKSIIGQAQTRKSAFYWAEIEFEYVHTRIKLKMSTHQGMRLVPWFSTSVIFGSCGELTHCLCPMTRVRNFDVEGIRKLP